MDVRCDRCETEYELDDGSVSDTGTSVQCTTCGHRFVVTRRSTSPLQQATLAPPGESPKPAEPDVPEWTLSTDDGKVHRFRDLNTLQKWIVERKATRSDRLSRAGGPWLALGDIEELASFFQVVDEADRARGPATPATPVGSLAKTATPAPARRGSMGSAPHATSGAAAGSSSTPPPIPFDARQSVSSDGPTVPNRPLPIPQKDAITPTRPARRTPGIGLPPAATAAPIVPSKPTSAVPKPPSQSSSRPVPVPVEHSSAHTELLLGPDGVDDTGGLDADFLVPRHRGLNAVVAVLVLAGLGGAGGYYWRAHRAGTGGVSGPVTPPEADTTPDAGLTRAAADTPPAGRAGEAVRGDHAGETGGTAPPPSRGDLPTAAEAAPAPGTARAPGAGGSRGKASSGTSPSHAAATTAVASRPAGQAGASATSYDRLVSEGDRMLERGQAAKAEKVYTQALAAKPDGAGALTGLAYVLLERQRHFKAIEMFRRVLDAQPTYGPALFGIAESYRARGDTTQALAAYRQYMVISPSGADAPAARRQIKDLESAGTQASSTERGASVGKGPSSQPSRQDE